MRDETYMVVRELQERDDIRGFYADIYPNGDKENEDILVCGDTKTADVLDMIFQEIFKREEDFRFSYNGYGLEYACEGDENWTFDDAGTWCTECGKWYYYNENGYTGYARFYQGDGYRLCEHCLREDNEGFFNDLLNNPNNANTIFEDSELENLGWKKVGKYENGMYGSSGHDVPSEVLKEKLKENPNGKYIFSIHKTYNPWETVFDLWEKMKGDEEC